MIFSFTQALVKTELLLFILRWGKQTTGVQQTS